MTWQPQQLREWHQQVMDFIILNPKASYSEIAEHVGSTPMTIGAVVRSDLFQARLAERRAGREDRIEDSIVRRLRGVAEASLDALAGRIEREGQALAIADIRETAEMALQGLGYGTGKGKNGAVAAAQTDVNLTVVVNRDDLAEARKIMRRKLEVIDAEPVRALPAAG